ncbi:MAG: NHL repeat-containing protein [Phycisphaera sp.]|nr:MAG: NHL repeat-containing protein [Phycisphaera sp.]
MPRTLTIPVLTAALGLAAAGAPAHGQTQHLLVGDYAGDRIVRFGWPDGRVIDHFVAAGLSPLANTRTMVLGPDGLLYVASQITDSVLRYDAGTGEYLGEFVAPGFGGLEGPIGIVFTPDGDLLVSSRANDRVLRFEGGTGAAMGAFVAPRSGGLDVPHKGLVFAANGSLLVSSFQNDSVLRYDGQTGAFLEVAVESGELGLDQPTDLALLPDGRVLVCSYASDAILEIDPEGEVSVFVAASTTPLDQPQDIELAPDGTVFVSYNGRDGGVLRFAQDGAYLGVFLTGTAGGIDGFPASLLFVPEPCEADFDGDGSLTIFDFLAFQNAFDAGCP